VATRTRYRTAVTGNGKRHGIHHAFALELHPNPIHGFYADFAKRLGIKLSLSHQATF